MADNKTPAVSRSTPSPPIPQLQTTAYATQRMSMMMNSHEHAWVSFEMIERRVERRDPRGNRTAEQSPAQV